MSYTKSYNEGKDAESRFITLLGNDRFIRVATRAEDRGEHWDVLTTIGKIDVKGKKRNKRNDANADPDIHYYEFKNVAGNIGWGIPTDIDRIIAFEAEEGFILVRPEDIYYPLLDKCARNGGGAGFFECRGRAGRLDWFTKVPTHFLRTHSFATIRNGNGL